ncbi:MAG: hypothetical protein R2825_20715 [Saprospiraceae bacterium]
MQTSSRGNLPGATSSAFNSRRNGRLDHCLPSRSMWFDELVKTQQRVVFSGLGRKVTANQAAVVTAMPESNLTCAKLRAGGPK